MAQLRPSAAIKAAQKNDCEGCSHCEVPGIRYPATIDHDSSKSWVERCDECQRFESDEAAAKTMGRHLGTAVAFGVPDGHDDLHPYLVGSKGRRGA